MEKRIKMEKFYLGTDIGTNSVGIACTDENYERKGLLGGETFRRKRNGGEKAEFPNFSETARTPQTKDKLVAGVIRSVHRGRDLFYKTQ